jgi:hypothetical protein
MVSANGAEPTLEVLSLMSASDPEADASAGLRMQPSEPLVETDIGVKRHLFLV